MISTAKILIYNDSKDRMFKKHLKPEIFILRFQKKRDYQTN